MVRSKTNNNRINGNNNRIHATTVYPVEHKKFKNTDHNRTKITWIIVVGTDTSVWKLNMIEIMARIK
jgi:hypothetical protein